MVNLFDLEQRIMNCWGVVDDIRLMNEMDVSKDVYESLANIYQYKFEALQKEFEKVTQQYYKLTRFPKEQP